MKKGIKNKITVSFLVLLFILAQSGCASWNVKIHIPRIQPSACKIADTYDYSIPVVEKTPVEDSYFEDAVFIGDSRTTDVKEFGIIKNTTVYAAISLAINQLDKKEVVEVEEGKKITVMEALKRKQFKKIYIMYGYNELGWSYPEIFIEKYREVIDQIQALQPEAIIYVELIFKPTKAAIAKDINVTEEKIILFNDMIKQMAIDKKLYVIDLTPVLQDETGYLYPEGTADGVHLTPPYMNKWYDFIKTRTVEEKDYEKEDCELS